MIENAKVSIIVPVYNAELYIKECVDSLLRQSYSNLEIILVDDGSSDRTGEIIVSEYADNPRIVSIQMKHEGVSAARNMGLQAASGSHITFVDSDDWVDPDFIKNALRFMKEYELDIVLGGTVKVYPSYQKAYCADSEKLIWVYEDMHVIQCRILSNGVAASELNHCFTSGVVCRVFRKEILENLKFDSSLSIGEDTVFNLISMEHAERMGIVSQPWYYYRMHTASATSRLRSNIEAETERLVHILYQKYSDKEEYKKYLAVRAVQQFHGMLLLNALHKESALNFTEKRRYIEHCLQTSPWKEVFVLTEAKRLPAGEFDKVLFRLCQRKRVVLIMVLIHMRLQGKALINLMNRLRKKTG